MKQFFVSKYRINRESAIESKQIGKFGEFIVKKALLSRGHVIHETNYRYLKNEYDLVFSITQNPYDDVIHETNDRHDSRETSKIYFCEVKSKVIHETYSNLLTNKYNLFHEKLMERLNYKKVRAIYSMNNALSRIGNVSRITDFVPTFSFASVLVFKSRVSRITPYELKRHDLCLNDDPNVVVGNRPLSGSVSCETSKIMSQSQYNFSYDAIVQITLDMSEYL